jgi:hypothetical protein
MTPVTQNNSGQTLLERGVYTLANDVVIEYFQAFVRSFRRTNPALPLTVIPFNENISRLKSLQGKFHFEIMDESKCCHYDALVDKVKGIKKHASYFRKFASFFGNYREFLFLDSDIVTLVPLDRFFNAFSGSPSEFVYFDRAMVACYKPNLADVMVSQYGSPAYNSGAFFSRRETIAEEEIFAAAETAAAVCDEFAIGGEQPFLNFVTDISRLRYADISTLAPDLAIVIWARQPFAYDWKTDTAKNSDGKPMPFIHWAGCAYPTMVRPEIFLRYRTTGLTRSARIRYNLLFYFLRYRVYILTAQSRWRKVIIQRLRELMAHVFCAQTDRKQN